MAVSSAGSFLIEMYSTAIIQFSRNKEIGQCHSISNDRIFVISLVSIRPRKTSSTTIL
ncbi:hypothetical protein GTQ52_05955 [Streptococcus pyogenes]|nr:hypothetical protein [Streptococcus pyogenes]